MTYASKYVIYFIAYQYNKSLGKVLRRSFRHVYLSACKPLCETDEIRVADFVSARF